MTRAPRRIPSGVLILLAIIPVLIAGSVWAVAILNQSFTLQRNVLVATHLNDVLFESELNEEAGLRGFAATGSVQMLPQYTAGHANFERSRLALSETLARTGLPHAQARIDGLIALNRAFEERVGVPTIRQHQRYASLQVVGKTLIQRFRDASRELDRAIQQRSEDAAVTTRNAILQLGASTMLLCVILALLIAYASRRQQRLLLQIQTEQRLIGVLQSALVNQLKPLAGLDIGTAYISATTDAAIGGDFYDVQPLDATVGYLLIGDVSGKGVNAAVDTVLARHSIRSLIAVLRDPGEVLTRLNEVFAAGRSGEDIFVSVFLGVIDTASNQLIYASAGHGPVYLRRASGTVEQLPVTGPLIGIPGPAEVASARAGLQSGDVLLLATDGLTEARSVDGTLLDDNRAMAWLAESKAPSSQALVAEVITRLKTYSPAMGDDLALLALSIA